MAGVEAVGGHANVGLPSFHWVHCDFPEVKYPIPHNESFNNSEEERVIDHFWKLIKEWKNTINPVRAVVIEPVTYFGHKIAKPSFYKTIR